MPTGLSDQDIDKTCMYCGEVMEGPHKGEKIDVRGPSDPGQDLPTYKGTYVSHCSGHGCAKEKEYQKELDDYKRGKQAAASYFSGSKRARRHKQSGDVPDIKE